MLLVFLAKLPNNWCSQKSKYGFQIGLYCINDLNSKYILHFLISLLISLKFQTELIEKIKEFAFITRILCSLMFTFYLLVRMTSCSCIRRKNIHIIFKLLAVVAAYSHLSQAYFTLACSLPICFFRLLGVVAAYSHIAQGYLTPSCLGSIWIFKLLAVDADIRIYHKDISLLHVYSQYVSSDYLV